MLTFDQALALAPTIKGRLLHSLDPLEGQRCGGCGSSLPRQPDQHP